MKKAIPQFLVYLLLLSIAGVFYYFSNQYADEILTINSSGGNYLPAPQHNSFGGEDLPAPKNSYGGEELPAPQANTFHVLIGAAFFSDSMIPVSIFHRILAILIVTSPIWIFTGYLFARKGSLIGIFKSKVDFYYSVVIFFFLLIGHSLLIDYAEMTYIYENVLTIELQFFEVLYKQILRNLFIQFFLISLLYWIVSRATKSLSRKGLPETIVISTILILQFTYLFYRSGFALFELSGIEILGVQLINLFVILFECIAMALVSIIYFGKGLIYSIILSIIFELFIITLMWL
jgi:hypothetical protein